MVELQTHDQKVLGSISGRSRGRNSSPCQLSVLTLIAVSVPPLCYRSNA